MQAIVSAAHEKRAEAGMPGKLERISGTSRAVGVDLMNAYMYMTIGPRRGGRFGS